MAATQAVLGVLDLGGARLHWGTFTHAGGTTTGTIDIRTLLGGTATKVPFTLIGGGIVNCTTATAPDLLFSVNGTMAYTTTANDTGTWYMLSE